MRTEHLTIPLTTDRLVLRPFQALDWRAMYEWDTEPETIKHLTYDCERTQAAARDKVRRYQAQSMQQPRLVYTWAIALRHNNLAIGEIELNLQEDQSRAWIAYRLHPAHRNQGYMTEALRRVMQFGFETLHLHRIKITVEARNERSLRVVERCGLRYEGTSRKEFWSAEKWSDTVHYALLSREWLHHAESSFSPPTERMVEDHSIVGDRSDPGWGELRFERMTPDLHLRAFASQDWVRFHSFRFHPLSTSQRYLLPDEDGFSEAEAREFVQLNVRKAREQPRHQYAWIIISREDERTIGWITLDVPQDRRVGWLSGHIHPDYLDRDVAAKGVQAALDVGFTDLQLQRISCDCWSDDSSALAVLNRTGMQPEAHFLEAKQIEGVWRSFFCYVAFADTWTLW